jgi:DNA primase
VTRPLERAAWMLMQRSDLWEQLPPELCDLLCDQPVPLGAYFSWLDRQIVEHGPMQASELMQRLQGGGQDDHDDPAAIDESLQSLARRLSTLHGFEAPQEKASELIDLLRPIQLQTLRDELDLLLQSGELSEIAEARKRELIRLSGQLKLEISQSRPISG